MLVKLLENNETIKNINIYVIYVIVLRSNFLKSYEHHRLNDFFSVMKNFIRNSF